MSEKVAALVSVKTFSNKGTTDLKSTLKIIASKFEISKVSSVYKVSRRAESWASLRDVKKEERLEGLAVVVLVQSDGTAQQALSFFEEAESSLQSEQLKRTVSLNLLTFGSQVIMLPGLAIPHPEMHLRPEEIVPAVEICPNYVHPVLNESLTVLSRRFVGQSWGEFFAQGQALLDF